MAVIDVIKYNGPQDVFVWKYPSEELGTWTQLVVNDSQEAVLFKSGIALDVLGGGRHTLSTANIPLLNNIINLPFGGRSPFTAEVWYVNKLHVLDIKWGTPSPIQIQDPKYGIFTPVRAFGQFGVKIENSRKCIGKLVGTTSVFDKDSLIKYFRGLYIAKVKDSISSYLVHQKVSILEINAYLDELSGHIQERMKAVMAEYGIELVNFYVNDINVPEGDEAVIKLKNALAKKAEMNIIGYDYKQERSFNTLEGAATNPGSTASSLLGAGLGLGMGVGMGGAVGRQFSGFGKMMQVDVETAVPCTNCKADMPQGARFCPACGQDAAKTVKSSIVVCDKCKAPLHGDDKFCSECGDAYNPCPNCNQDLSGDARKCTFCGYVLPQKCSLCGERVKDVGAKFCAACGESLVKRCPACQADISGAVKFCVHCGSKITINTEG